MNSLPPLPCLRRRLSEIQACGPGILSHVLVKVVSLQPQSTTHFTRKKNRKNHKHTTTWMATLSDATPLSNTDDNLSLVMPLIECGRFQRDLTSALQHQTPLLLTHVQSLRHPEEEEGFVLTLTTSSTLVANTIRLPSSSSPTRSCPTQQSLVLDNNHHFTLFSPLCHVYWPNVNISLEPPHFVSPQAFQHLIMLEEEDSTVTYRPAILTIQRDGQSIPVEANVKVMQQLCADMDATTLWRDARLLRTVMELWKGLLGCGAAPHSPAVNLVWTLEGVHHHGVDPMEPPSTTTHRVIQVSLLHL